MTAIRNLWHRIRHGHRREPWSIAWGLDLDPSPCCRRCIRDAVMADVDNERRIGGGGW